MTSSYTNVFGGTVIYPAEVSYRAVALTGNLTLSWPTEVSTDQNVVSQIMDVTPSAGGFAITMPPANQVSVGETTLIFNVGSYAFTVKDNAGNTIASIDPGLAWQLYVTNNATAAGGWRPIQYAAGASSATAGALAGSGIKAISSTLNQSAPIISLADDYTIGNTDRARVFLWTGGAGTFTLPSASTVGNDWFCYVRNSGTGAVTVVGPGGETINGDVNLVFNPGDSSSIICDGSDYFTVGFGQSAEFTFDYVAINLTGQTSPYSLSGANLNRITYNFSGILTGNMIVVVPDTVQQYWVANNTTGSYSLTIANSSGTGVSVPQGARTILYCDGVDIYPAETAGLSYPIAVSQGGTGATNAPNALVNLGGSATGIAIFSAVSQSAAQVAIGASAVGQAVFIAADAAAAQTAIGATSTGQAVFTAANAAAARTAIGAAASGANTDITALDQDVTITATGTIAANTIGYRGIPASAQSQGSAITLALSDASGVVANTTGGWVIPANGSVAFPIGTAIVLFNNSGSSQTVSITTDTLRWAGTASTGSRTIAQYGLATVVKVASTTWVISGAGVS
jgi:hypothetical protein